MIVTKNDPFREIRISARTQLTLQLDDPLKRSGKVSLEKYDVVLPVAYRNIVVPRRLQLVDLVSSIGAYDRLYDGLFEHYLTLHFHDPKLKSVGNETFSAFALFLLVIRLITLTTGYYSIMH